MELVNTVTDAASWAENRDEILKADNFTWEESVTDLPDTNARSNVKTFNMSQKPLRKVRGWQACTHMGPRARWHGSNLIFSATRWKYRKNNLEKKIKFTELDCFYSLILFNFLWNWDFLIQNVHIRP